MLLFYWPLDRVKKEVSFVYWLLESLEPNLQWTHGKNYYMYICIIFVVGSILYMSSVFHLVIICVSIFVNLCTLP